MRQGWNKTRVGKEIPDEKGKREGSDQKLHGQILDSTTSLRITITPVGVVDADFKGQTF